MRHTKTHSQKKAAQKTKSKPQRKQTRRLTTTSRHTTANPTTTKAITTTPRRGIKLQSNSPETQKARETLRKSVLAVTPGAADRVKMLCESNDAKGLRLGLRTRGCNGLSYTMNFADAPKNKLEETIQLPDSDIKIYIDNKALLYLVGTTMDWVETDVAAEFTFNNPNSKGSCGCGESFNV